MLCSRARKGGCRFSRQGQGKGHARKPEGWQMAIRPSLCSCACRQATGLSARTPLPSFAPCRPQARVQQKELRGLCELLSEQSQRYQTICKVGPLGARGIAVGGGWWAGLGVCSHKRLLLVAKGPKTKVALP